MNSFHPHITRGFRPYLALAALLFLLYLILAPFVSLGNAGAVQNETPPVGTSGAQAGHGSPGGQRPGTPPQGNAGGSHQVFTDTARSTPFSHALSGSGSSAAESDATARGLMAAVVLLTLAAAAVLQRKRCLTPRRATLALLAAGFAMRFGYMLYTPYSVRGHDVGSLNGDGHLAYLQQIYQHFALPSSGSGQFYHPPLNYIFEALTAHLYALVTGSTDLSAILESARLVPCFASCALLIVCCRIFRELGFRDPARLTTLGILAFHPTFFLLSASINNDMLMVFFLMTAFLYTIRWYHQPNFKNCILLALASGLAMMTKFSGGLILLFSGMVFCMVVVQELRHKIPIGRRFAQLAVYSAIFFPLGLWYSIRNLILFHQPIGYVLQIGGRATLDGTSWADRFLSFPLSGLFSPLYCNPNSDSNLPLYIVKCSLFGEFSFPDSHQWAAGILIALNLLLIALSVLAAVFLLVRRKRTGIAEWSFPALWSILIAFFLYFNIKYPYPFTMDFRYIVPTLIAGAAFIGLFSETLQSSGRKWSLRCIYVLISTFAAVSTLFYVM